MYNSLNDECFYMFYENVSETIGYVCRYCECDIGVAFDRIRCDLENDINTNTGPCIRQNIRDDFNKLDENQRILAARYYTSSNINTMCKIRLVAEHYSSLKKQYDQIVKDIMRL